MSSEQVTQSNIGLAPGIHVAVRDEEWLITAVKPTVDGEKITVRGITPFVRDLEAVFFTSLDKVTPIDPRQVKLVADTSPHYRTTRLFLESTLRKTPVSIYEPNLQVSDDMLVDTLDYQRTAVRKALSSKSLRPRLLIADAVGLGKTIEIGLILSELIRRGRGDRILMVVPNHILEQMQKEMWNRFSLPFVRLDSTGIQQVRRKIPATRNPFTYFNKVIISIDTLKQPKYRAQLEKVFWDIVVLDEAHNVTNSSTQNNDLARILAPRAEALILASATPHNGKEESFAELIRLLDPTAVSPKGKVDPAELDRLVVRRHRYSQEVAIAVGSKWAEREEPNNILVTPTGEEAAVSEELNRSWLSDNPVSGKDRLFPWTLFKASLSSPRALQVSIENRLKKVEGTSSATDSTINNAAETTTANEAAALRKLLELNAAVTPEKSSKYQALVKYLKEIGVGPNSETRVVIFSERVETLAWLKESLQKSLKMKDNQLATMTGNMSDVQQQETVERFKRSTDSLRILITGDVASEGVNLHAQCHHLVHYDVPWSLIRIQQRNGRVDRFGQMERPIITTLLVDDTEAGTGRGDLRVFSRLIEREFEASKTLGDIQVLMGEYSVAREEDEIRKVLQGTKDIDDAISTVEEAAANDILALPDFSSLFDDDPVETTSAAADVPTTTADSLYQSDHDFIDDALMAAFAERPDWKPQDGGVAWNRHDDKVFELAPTEDLALRLQALPQDFLKELNIDGLFRFTTNKTMGNTALTNARDGIDGRQWPKIHFLSPLHPLTEWASDRALSSMGRQEVPVIRGDVDGVQILLMGTWSNLRGQTITRAFYVYSELGTERLLNPAVWVKEELKLSQDTFTVPLSLDDFPQLTDLLNQAITDTEGLLDQLKAEATSKAKETIDSWNARKQKWEADADELRSTTTTDRLRRRIEAEQALVNQLMPQQKVIRPLVIVVPHNA